MLSYELRGSAKQGWELQFEIDNDALHQLLADRFGRTTLVTNRADWTAAEVATAYSGQQQVEQVFGGLKGGHLLDWGPMCHWTDSKIRVHAFYCLLGISLLQYLHRKAQPAWPGLTIAQLRRELGQIQHIELLFPRLGKKGPRRAATGLSKQSLAQVALTEALGLDDLLKSLSG